MTPAHIRYLHEVARQLDAAPAVGGERGRIVARAAETLGKSAKTVYALLRRHAGWCSGRKARADSGVTCVDRELALTVGGLVHVGRRQNGKKTTSIKAARELLQANGLGVPDESTGEIVMPSVATLSRAMRAQGCHPDQLRCAAPASALRSLHPNHTWELDASVCVLYRMKGSRAVRLLNERDYNEHKPGKLLEVAGQRIIRYVVADHYSGALYVRYEQARGEDALGVTFAGQYRSELNVLPEEACEVWKEIVASKYAVTAMSYRFQRGIPDEAAPMSVGVLSMVQALAGGVAYSRDPVASRQGRGQVTLNAVPGLPQAVVDGAVTPDVFAFSRQNPPELLEKHIAHKAFRLDCAPEALQGVVRSDLEGEAAVRPSLTDAQARELAQVALALEEYTVNFG